MSQDNELRRLEQFVEKLLARFNDLREENAQLQEQLREREQRIGELRHSLSARDEERSEITHRVGKMVEQIEEWEAALGEDKPEVAVPVAEDEPQIVEASEDAEPIEEPPKPVEHRHEEEGRIQHNLFSLGAANR